MEKHEVSVCSRMFMFTLSLALILTLSLGLASANTLVGGKIYNSDFSGVIGGADVSVQCGTDVLDTESLSDGTYAVTFDTDSCYAADEVKVTASKGDLSGNENSIINNSTEEEGEYVAVANVNIKSTNTVNVGRHRGTWFECGNSVCDTGETTITCPSDCSDNVVLEEPPVTLITLGDTSNSGNEGGDRLPGETQTVQNTSNIPGITGAVTGTGDGDNGNFWLYLLGLVILLAIAIAIISLVRGNIHRKKMGYH